MTLGSTGSLAPYDNCERISIMLNGGRYIPYLTLTCECRRSVDMPDLPTSALMKRKMVPREFFVSSRF